MGFASVDVVSVLELADERSSLSYEAYSSQ